jgi:hypothetical protein
MRRPACRCCQTRMASSSRGRTSCSRRAFCSQRRLSRIDWAVRRDLSRLCVGDPPGILHCARAQDLPLLDCRSLAALRGAATRPLRARADRCMTRHASDVAHAAHSASQVFDPSRKLTLFARDGQDVSLRCLI